MTNNSVTPIILQEDLQDRLYHHFEQALTQRIHHFYISQSVEAPELYADMIFKIQTAGPDDIVYIHLNTPGGRLDTGVQLVNAMQSTPAHVVCSLEGSVASLGTMIFLAADEWIVHDFSMMMFHNYSGGVFGKGHEQIAALEATTRWVNDLMGQLYIPFMSEEEWGRVRKGEDLYFQAEEIRDRLANMVEILEELKKAEEEAEEEADVIQESIKATRRKTKTPEVVADAEETKEVEAPTKKPRGRRKPASDTK